MSDNNDFEIVESPKNIPAPQQSRSSTLISPGVDKLAGTVADNFDRILDIASSILEIEHMRTQSNQYIKKLSEERMLLATEAEAYVKKIKAETGRTVSKTEEIRLLLRDYYIYGQNRLSSEEFCRIISGVLDLMGEF